MLHHFPHQAIDGRWHTVYRVPGCDFLHSVGDGVCKASAAAEADRLNAQYAEQHGGQTPQARPDRPIVSGFYTDRDAA